MSDPSSFVSSIDDIKKTLSRGMAARRAGEVEASREAFLAALEGCRELDVPELEVLALVNLGTLAQQLGNLDSAERRFETGLELAERLGDEHRIALCEGNLASIYLEQGRPGAEALLKSSLTRYREIDDDAGIGNQLGNLGRLYQSRGKYAEAIEALGGAAEHFVRAGHASGAGNALRAVGEIHKRTGKTVEAIDAFERSLALARRSGDVLGEAYARRAIGQFRLAEGDLSMAVGHFRAALGLHDQVRDVRGQSAAALDLGQALASRGEMDAAFEHLERAVEIAREHGLGADVLASALIALGTQRAHTGRPEEGLEALAEAADVFERAGDPHGLGAAELNHVTVLLQLGRWEDAERRLNETERVVARHGLSTLEPSVTALRGQLARLRGELPDAERHFADAQRGFAAVGRARQAASARISRAMCRLELGDRRDAVGVLTAEAEASRDRDNPGTLAEALQGLARDARLEGRYSQALAWLDEALALADRMHNPSVISGLLLHRALVNLRAESWRAETFERLDDVTADLDAAAAHLRQQGFVPRQALLDVWRAELSRRRRELDEATRQLERARTDAQAIGYQLCLGQAHHIEARIARDRRDAAGMAAAVEAAEAIFEAAGAVAHLSELYADFEDAG